MTNPDAIRLAQTLEWRETGEGAPLLLVHGIQGTADAWSPLLPALSARRCTAPNLPGRGLSPRWCEGSGVPLERYYHLDHYADLIQALLLKLREQHGRPVALAGWSMGVSVILNLLARHGDRLVDRVVLISGTACASPGAVWFHGETPEVLAEEARERARRLGLKAVADADAVAATWASVRGADLRDAARGIRVPTLVVHGEQDDQCPLEHGRWLADNVRQAKWLPLVDVGHSALGACPDDLGSSMSSFLKH
jgi:pimeloyl-ACP methyl ester carboxylesterase